ncbi:MAG TPA: hypothetical protein PK082_05995 [Phycisphaerae bacterium]|nr:hypothetical protein [Phycisphaerae bacterium]
MKRFAILLAVLCVVAVAFQSAIRNPNSAMAADPPPKSFTVTIYDEDPRMWTDCAFLCEQAKLRSAIDLSNPNESAPSWLIRNNYWNGKSVNYVLKFAGAVSVTPAKAQSNIATYAGLAAKMNPGDKTLLDRYAQLIRRNYLAVVQHNEALASGGWDVLLVLPNQKTAVKAAVTGAKPDFSANQLVRFCGTIHCVMQDFSGGFIAYATGTLEAAQ